MLQLRFVPVSQGMWVSVPVFIWIRADLSTCTKALLNHGLNFHAGHFLNPVENTHEAAANPSAQQRRNCSKNSVWHFILCILPSKTISTTVVSLPTADWQPEVHFRYNCACCESQGMLRPGVSYPPSFQRAAGVLLPVLLPGAPWPLWQQGGSTACWAVLDTTVPAGCSWGSRDCSGHCAAGIQGSESWGAPELGGCLAHFPEPCFHLAGLQLTGWTLPLCLLKWKWVGPRQALPVGYWSL